MASQIIFNFVSPPNDEGNTGGQTTHNYSLSRFGDLDQPVTVNWVVLGTGNSPVTADDFVGGVLPSGQVTFDAGQVTPETLSFQVMGDSVVEANEQYLVSLTLDPNSPPDTTLVTPFSSGSVLNDDSEISIVAVDADKAEGNSVGPNLIFEVRRTGDLDQPVTVKWQAQGGAQDPAITDDFVLGQAFDGELIFQPGEASKLLTFEVNGDTTFEQNESLQVNLLPLENPPAGTTLGADTATGTIENDDVALPEVSIDAAGVSQPEGNAGTTLFTFIVTRSGADLSQSSTADWAVSSSGLDPAEADDFVFGSALSGQVTFAANDTSKTIEVEVQGDVLVEGDEEFTVTLSAPQGATLGQATATGTIENDDAPPVPELAITADASAVENDDAPPVPELAITADASAVQNEGDTGAKLFTFTVTRTGDTSGSSTVDYETTPSGTNPVDATDFVFGSTTAGQLTFAATPRWSQTKG
jgi:hypothetical protein